MHDWRWRFLFHLRFQKGNIFCKYNSRNIPIYLYTSFWKHYLSLELLTLQLVTFGYAENLFNMYTLVPISLPGSVLMVWSMFGGLYTRLSSGVLRRITCRSTDLLQFPRTKLRHLGLETRISTCLPIICWSKKYCLGVNCFDVQIGVLKENAALLSTVKGLIIWFLRLKY